MVAIKGVGGSCGPWAHTSPALQQKFGCKGAASAGVHPGVLDESWFSIYRLPNIFRVAGRRDTLPLPTRVHVESDFFP